MKIIYLYLIVLVGGCAMNRIIPPTTLDFQEEQTPNFSSDFKTNTQTTLEPELQKKLALQDEIVRLLDTKLQKLENILQAKEQEIATLKKNQQKIALVQEKEQKQSLTSTEKQEQRQLATQNKLIAQAIEKDLAQTFRINTQPLNFEIGANKKTQVEPQKDLMQQQILQIKTPTTQQFSITQQILNIPLTAIQPHLLLTPPANPIILTRISGAHNLYKKAYSSFVQKNYTNAIDEFHRYIEEYPKDTATDNAFYWIGVTYWYQKNTEIAQKYFAYILQSFKFTPTNKGGKTADAMIMLGRISQPESLKDAKQYYQKVIALYPQSEASKIAQNLLQKLP